MDQIETIENGEWQRPRVAVWRCGVDDGQQIKWHENDRCWWASWATHKKRDVENFGTGGFCAGPTKYVEQYSKVYCGCYTILNMFSAQLNSCK